MNNNIMTISSSFFVSCLSKKPMKNENKKMAFIFKDIMTNICESGKTKQNKTNSLKLIGS